MPPRRFAATFLALLLSSSTLLFAEDATLTLLNVAHVWQRAEIRVEKVPASANNFDPDLIRVDAAITGPSGKTLTVPAFWFQDFRRSWAKGAEVLTPAGEAEWRIRFTPTEAGDYIVSLLLSQNGGPSEARGSLRFHADAAAAAKASGWVRTRADHRYFETSDGRPLRLIGENLCWSNGRGTYDFDTWIGNMEKSGQNFARLWMSPWFMGLEHRPGTLTHYRLDDAWQLDHLFQLGEEHGVYLMFCFDHHGMFQLDNQNWGGTNNFWKTNPYNQALGGPCATPNDFFTDPQAQTIYQKRLRYLIARYGYSPQLLAWQFFNEIDNVYAPRQTLKGPDVAAWHGVMGKWLHAQDPFHHLVTTSLTGGSDRPEIWSLPEMDFAMYHSYADPAPGRAIANVAGDYLRRYGKPVMIGEFGVSARDWAIASDPHLRGFRQALWSAALSGTVGTAMSWWWEDIQNDNVYSLYGALGRVLNTAAWQQGDWVPVAFADSRNPPADLAAPRTDETAFTADLALSSYRRQPILWEVAIASPLAAQRASEALSAYLLGSVDAPRQKPMKLTAFFNKDGKLSFHVNSVASDLELIVQIDGTEAYRTRLFDRDGLPNVNREIDREFSVPVPPGKHVIQIVNTGMDWVMFDSVRLSGVLPAAYPNDWQWGPEAVGLRNPSEKKAVLYVYSPHVVYPAGALRFQPPIMEGQRVALADWPDGDVSAHWYDAATGTAVATTHAAARDGQLVLPLPPFREDLAAVISSSAPEDGPSAEARRK